MVNVNAVYETVLAILNKEQRGYLDPEEFNLLSAQVQRELFESYFLKETQTPDMESDFANPGISIDEKIAEFEIQVDLAERSDDSFFEYPSDFYRLGVVLSGNVIIEPISHMKVAYMLLSNLTSPSEDQPVYVKEKGGIQVYPDGDANAITDVKMIYVKTPSNPVWGFDATEFDDSGEVIYSSDASTNFELHESEQHELVARILAYAGIVVRDPAVTGFAQQVEGKLNQTEA